jgi:hypothetical protein
VYFRVHRNQALVSAFSGTTPIRSLPPYSVERAKDYFILINVFIGLCGLDRTVHCLSHSLKRHGYLQSLTASIVRLLEYAAYTFSLIRLPAELSMGGYQHKGAEIL